MRILTVCTGNICRSPIAEQVLRARCSTDPLLAGTAIDFSSAGTGAETDQTMPEPAVAWSERLGGEPRAHRSRYLTETTLAGVDLVLAMEREHRSRVVSLAPVLLRRTFTLREFARLAAAMPDADLDRAMEGPLVGTDPRARLRAALGALADLRGMQEGPADPAGDDVVDPYRRSERTYALAAEQMLPGIDAVIRVLRRSAL